MEQKNPTQNKPFKTWEPGHFNRQSIPREIAQKSILFGVYTIDIQTGTVQLLNLGSKNKGDISEIVNKLYQK